MPRGIPKKYIRCNKCPGEKFKSISHLRKHQWSFHRDMFANVIAAAQTVTPSTKQARTAKARATLAAKRLLKNTATTTEITVREFIDTPTATAVLHANGTGDMTVAQLLATLKRKETFLADVIELIGGIQSAHQEAAHHE